MISIKQFKKLVKLKIMDEQQYSKLQKYKSLHFLVIGLLIINIVIRIYLLITKINGDTISSVPVPFYVFGVFVTIVILIAVIKTQAIGYMIATGWFSSATEDLLQIIASIVNIVLLLFLATF